MIDFVKLESMITLTFELVWSKKLAIRVGYQDDKINKSIHNFYIDPRDRPCWFSHWLINEAQK